MRLKSSISALVGMVGLGIAGGGSAHAQGEAAPPPPSSQEAAPAPAPGQASEQTQMQMQMQAAAPDQGPPQQDYPIPPNVIGWDRVVLLRRALIGGCRLHLHLHLCLFRRLPRGWRGRRLLG